MLKFSFRTLAMIATYAFTATHGQAAGPGELARGLAPGLSESFINEREPTLAPFAHVRFCMKNPSECQASDADGFEVATPSMEEELLTVNRTINRRVKQINDNADDFGDSWTVAQNFGDCEDIALAKRKELISKGWPSRALRIAVTKTRTGEGHAVLVARTSRGDLVLDNRHDAVKIWKSTDLTWLKIQSAENPRLWLSL